MHPSTAQCSAVQSISAVNPVALSAVLPLSPLSSLSISSHQTFQKPHSLLNLVFIFLSLCLSASFFPSFFFSISVFLPFYPILSLIHYLIWNTLGSLMSPFYCLFVFMSFCLTVILSHCLSVVRSFCVRETVKNVLADFAR